MGWLGLHIAAMEMGEKPLGAGQSRSQLNKGGLVGDWQATAFIWSLF